jgi:Tfp pilus assembly protein PilZ
MMVSEARVIVAPFESREALAEALIHDLDDGGLFIAGEHDLAAGERVQVLVRLEGIEPGLLMVATVLWRRVGRGGRAPAGVGVSFAHAEATRFAWLRSIAMSGVDARGRIASRFPVSIPVAYVLSRETSVRSGTLVDISDGGALLHAVPAPASDQVVVIRLRDGRSGPPVPSRVAWTAAESAGLGILADRAEVRRFWDRIVGAARAEIEARLVPTGRTSQH